MRNATGTAVIDAPLESVHRILIAAPQLPDWNPAFLRVAGPSHAVTGTVYALEAIGGKQGTLTYSEVQDLTIKVSWQVPMLSEEGLWQLQEQAPNRTVVTHVVTRKGALALTLAHTLRTLPALRLTRLAERIAATRTA